jgi:aminoglycoside phosphotransferase (APT) family kinase protein
MSTKEQDHALHQPRGADVSVAIDTTRPPRAGEELDLERLSPWLRKQLSVPPETEIAIEQFPGGHSNLTYLVRVGNRELVLRRPPFGSKVKSAHDMGREVRVLSRLAPIYPKAPKPVVFCEDESVIGAKFYLMERLRGVILRKSTPLDTLDQVTARGLGEALVDTLVELHAIDPVAAGLGDFGRPEGYVERQVSGWTKRYADAKTDDIPEVEEMARRLAASIPQSPAPTIIHNDFKFDNLVLDPADLTKVIGILDWEMSTIGDPFMDLGTTLCYWVEPGDLPELVASRYGPTTAPGSLTRRDIVERYAARSGRDVHSIDFYYRFGLFKTAVVAQQIYVRYKQGLTKDERFASMIFGVRALAKQALDGPRLQ